MNTLTASLSLSPTASANDAAPAPRTRPATNGRMRESARVACSACDLHDLCKHLDAHRHAANFRRQFGECALQVQEGEFLCVAGQPARSVFAVRSGMLKSIALTPDGEEHVVGLHLPGDVLALDAVHSGRYRYDIVALERSYVCATPLEHSLTQMQKTPRLSNSVLRLLSRALSEQSQRLRLARGSARQRVLGLVCDLASRLDARGMNGRQWRLSASRRDIASLLDTRIETVSRMLKRLQAEGIIGVRGKRIVLLMPPAQALERAV